MSNTSLQILINQVKAAAQLVPVGACYRHNGSGDVYEIVGHAMQEATQKVQVLYRRALLPTDARSIDDQLPVWARDYAVFTGSIEAYEPENGGLISKPRFTRVKRRNAWVEE